MTAETLPLLTPEETGLQQVSPHWWLTRDGDVHGRLLFQQHYSFHRYKDGRSQKRYVGPGERMVLLLADGDGMFVWRKFRSMDEQEGVSCSVFRNESPTRGSVLVREAMDLAWERWPGERLYTYVNARAIRSSNPGCCFKKCGWKRCGTTLKGLHILEVRPSPLLLEVA